MYMSSPAFCVTKHLYPHKYTHCMELQAAVSIQIKDTKKNSHSMKSTAQQAVVSELQKVYSFL